MRCYQKRKANITHLQKTINTTTNYSLPHGYSSKMSFVNSSAFVSSQTNTETEENDSNSDSISSPLYKIRKPSYARGLFSPCESPFDGKVSFRAVHATAFSTFPSIRAVRPTLHRSSSCRADNLPSRSFCIQNRIRCVTVRPAFFGVR